MLLASTIKLSFPHSRVVATGAADTVQILIYIHKITGGGKKIRFIGGVLLLWAGQLIFDLYWQISDGMKMKHGGVGARTFIYHALSESSFVCSAGTLCSCAPWPCLSLTGCSTSYTEESVLYGPQNNSPSHSEEETFGSGLKKKESLEREGKQWCYIPIVTVNTVVQRWLWAVINKIWIWFQQNEKKTNTEFTPFE